MMDKNQAILKHFDNIFKTDTSKHINYEDMKLLKAIYSYLEEKVTTPSKRYKEIRHKRVVMSEQLRRIRASIYVWIYNIKRIRYRMQE